MMSKYSFIWKRTRLCTMNWIISLQFEIHVKYFITWPVHIVVKVCERTKALGFYLKKKKVHLGISRKMPKGYNKFIQYIYNPHVRLFQDKGWKKPTWWSISPLYSFSKRGEDICLFPNFSKLLLFTNHNLRLTSYCIILTS